MYDGGVNRKAENEMLQIKPSRKNTIAVVFNNIPVLGFFTLTAIIIPRVIVKISRLPKASKFLLLV